jgi:hypothetical protein
MAVSLELNHSPEGDVSAREPSEKVVTESRRQVAEEVWQVSTTYFAVQPDIDELRIKLDTQEPISDQRLCFLSTIEATLYTTPPRVIAVLVHPGTHHTDEPKPGSEGRCSVPCGEPPELRPGQVVRGV